MVTVVLIVDGMGSYGFVVLDYLMFEFSFFYFVLLIFQTSRGFAPSTPTSFCDKRKRKTNIRFPIKNIERKLYFFTAP